MGTNRATKTVGALANVARLILRAAPFVIVSVLLAACEPAGGTSLRVADRLSRHEAAPATVTNTSVLPDQENVSFDELGIQSASKALDTSVIQSEAPAMSLSKDRPEAAATAFALAWESDDIKSLERVVSKPLVEELFAVRSWVNRIDPEKGDNVAVSCSEADSNGISSCFVLNCCGPGYFLAVADVHGRYLVIDTDFVDTGFVDTGFVDTDFLDTDLGEVLDVVDTARADAEVVDSGAVESSP